jgi:hypothetical protein
MVEPWPMGQPFVDQVIIIVIIIIINIIIINTLMPVQQNSFTHLGALLVYSMAAAPGTYRTAVLYLRSLDEGTRGLQL